MKKTQTLSAWGLLAEKRLKLLLRKAHGFKELRKLGVFGDAPAWSVDVRMVGAPMMTRLNSQYRGKKYATDVLSFTAPEMFSRAGWLGELVICVPVLKRQARELEHTPEQELDVLLAHGILHLLGLDHEKGPRHAAKMARWEKQLLPAKSAGLIGR
jgi:rRNA maturation RNase YbeY